MLNSSTYNNEFGLWELSYTHKITFNGSLKLILINEGVTEIDVRVDMYSAWKQWVGVTDNSKYLPAFLTVGGDPIPDGTLGATIFLQNGWKIYPYPGAYRLIINGNIYSDDGTNPFNYSAGVSVMSVVSDLTTVKVQDVVSEVVMETILDPESLQLLTNAYLEAKKARQLQSNKAVIAGDIVTIYDDDGTTILHRFNVSSDKMIRTPI